MVDITLTAPDQSTPIVNQDGTMGVFFAEFVTRLTDVVNANSIPIVGTGSPEGIVSALQLRWYIDTSAPVGEGIYLKQSGTGNTGWVKRS
jgi:hypothetical protein